MNAAFDPATQDDSVPLERMKRTFNEASFRQAAFEMEQMEEMRLATLPPAETRGRAYRGRHALFQPGADSRGGAGVSGRAAGRQWQRRRPCRPGDGEGARRGTPGRARAGRRKSLKIAAQRDRISRPGPARLAGKPKARRGGGCEPARSSWSRRMRRRTRCGNRSKARGNRFPELDGSRRCRLGTVLPERAALAVGSFGSYPDLLLGPRRPGAASHGPSGGRDPPGRHNSAHQRGLPGARAWKLAAAQHASAVLIEINTPGGLLDSMRADGEQDHRLAGSRHRLCGTLRKPGRIGRILSAGSRRRGGDGSRAPTPERRIRSSKWAKIDDTMKQKLENDTAAFLRSYVARRGRNVAAAEDAVRNSKSYSDREALQLRLIDLIAPDNDCFAEHPGRPHHHPLRWKQSRSAYPRCASGRGGSDSARGNSGPAHGSQSGGPGPGGRRAADLRGVQYARAPSSPEHWEPFWCCSRSLP